MPRGHVTVRWTVTKHSAPPRPRFSSMLSKVRVWSTASPTRSGTPNRKKLPAHIRRGSFTGGRKPPRLGCPSGPSSECLATGAKSVQWNPGGTGSRSLGKGSSRSSVACHAASWLARTASFRTSVRPIHRDRSCDSSTVELPRPLTCGCEHGAIQGTTCQTESRGAVPDTSYQEIRDPVRALCARFDSAYWQRLDRDQVYPEEFVRALTEGGWLAALIPQEYGGAGLGLAEASVVLEEINRCGGNSGVCHGQMYNMGTVLRHGSEAQKRRYLPEIASGALRLQSMAVTEPTTGTDTTKLKTTAVRRGDRYLVNGQKIWVSRLQHTDLMILLARTTPLAEVKRKSEGLSIFLADVRAAMGHGLVARPIRNMVNHETNEVFFEDLEVPAENLIGEEGKGVKYILDGLNAERTLIAAECIGDGYWFMDKAARYT